MRAGVSSEAPRHVLMTTDAVGGVWTYALDLAAGLATRGVRTTLAIMGPSPTPQQGAAAEAQPGLTLVDTALPLDWTAETAGQVESAGMRLAALAADLRPDLIHLNSPALAAVARFTAPVVSVAHSCVKTWWRAVEGEAPLPADLAWRAEMTGRGYAAADGVIAPTAAFARATADAYEIAAPRVVWNGRSPGSPPSGQPPADFAFTAGRLWDRGKGAAILDRAAAEGAGEIVCAGPTVAPQGERLEASHLTLLGPLASSDLATWLTRRPIFVSASLYEPFGLAVLEAAQAGCALVLSDIPSFRELWEGAAVFVPAKDPAAFACAISALRTDGGERAKMAAAADARAGRYTSDAMLDGVLSVYGRCCRAVEAAA